MTLAPTRISQCRRGRPRPCASLEINPSLAVGEAVSHAVCGIAAGVYREGALQFVVAGFVQKIADRNHAGRSSSEKDQLASGSTFAERLCHGVHLFSSMAQVPMSNAKVQ